MFCPFAILTTAITIGKSVNFLMVKENFGYSNIGIKKVKENIELVLSYFIRTNFPVYIILPSSIT